MRMDRFVNDCLVGRRILVVEDEMLIAWAIADSLTGLGCKVVGPATRVDQAIAVIDHEPIDAALLDLNLDGQMSYPVVDLLVARHMLFIILTGYHKSNLPKEYQIFPLMQKPVGPATLADALTKLLTPASLPC